MRRMYHCIESIDKNSLQNLPNIKHILTEKPVFHLASLDGRGSVLAVVGRALGNGGGLLARGGSLELLANCLDGRGASGGDGSGTAKVGVDTSEHLAVVGLDVLDNNAAADRVLAVSASTVELTEILKDQC